MSRNDKLGIFVLTGIIVLCASLFTYTDWQKDTQVAKNKALMAQNVQLTKDVNTAKAEAFKMGVITCSNEDIATFHDLAQKYQGTALADLFNSMAQGWAYDDDTMQALIEEYMNDGTSY